MSNINVKPQASGTNELLGPGAIYVGGVIYDWTNNPGTLLGLTKGGSSFTDNAEFRRRMADTDYTPVKGVTDLVMITPQLTVNTLSMTTANLEKIYGGLVSHTVGTMTAETCAVDGTVSVGATSMTIDGGTASETLLKGDTFVVAGQEYIVTADATATTGSITVSFTPAVTVEIADDAVVAFNTTYTRLTRTFDVSTSYQDVLYWIGQTRAGNDIAIQLNNVLGDSPLSWSPAKNEEVVANMVFTAHADPDVFNINNSGTFPYKIYHEISA